MTVTAYVKKASCPSTWGNWFNEVTLLNMTVVSLTNLYTAALKRRLCYTRLWVRMNHQRKLERWTKANSPVSQSRTRCDHYKNAEVDRPLNYHRPKTLSPVRTSTTELIWSEWGSYSSWHGWQHWSRIKKAAAFCRATKKLSSTKTTQFSPLGWVLPSNGVFLRCIDGT